ncbi:MAG TPA: GYD domain-containing protein [Anaeromyxobacteraceae bacterium]|nr:GYD domain-containing protein [Anaeromyxobacteraceae bacterium]
MDENLILTSRLETHMATYVTLIRYTEQGIRNIKESPGRLDAAKKAFQAAGGELKQFYLAMGRYDALIVGEVPDDETAAKLALSLGALGNVRTETMRVFTEAEYRKIVGSLK